MEQKECRTRARAGPLDPKPHLVGTAAEAAALAGSTAVALAATLAGATEATLHAAEMAQALELQHRTH